MAILTLSAGDSVGLSNGNFNIFGTRSGSETVVLNDPGSGNLTVVLDSSFNAGGDTIVLSGAASDYSIVRSGSSVILTNGTTSVTIPVGTVGATVVFANGAGAGDDDARTLVFDTTQGAIFLGNQDVGFQSEQVDAGNQPPAPLTVAVDNISVTEGDSGSKLATFTLTLSEVPTEAVTVSYGTAPGSATPNDDYIPQSGTVTFAAGQQTATVSVSVLGDVIDEANETFTLTVNLNGQTTVGTATIIDNDEVQATFTSGLDTLTGTESADVFVAQNNALNAGDSVSGLGGDDTIRLSVDGSVGNRTFAGFTSTSVENVQVTNDSGGQISVDLSGSQGLEQVETINSSASTQFIQVPNIVDVNVTNLTNDINPVDVAVQFQNSAVAGAADEVDVNVSESSVDTVRVGSNGNVNGGVETINLNVEGDSTIAQLDSNVSTLNISGDGNIVINDLVDGTPTNLTEVDATDASGDLTVSYVDATNSVTFTGSTGNDTVTGSNNGDVYDTRSGADDVTAGTGDDDITTGTGDDVIATGGGNDIVDSGEDNDSITVTGAGDVDIDMGDGDDTTEFTNGFDASNIGPGNPRDQVDGGDGRDTLVINENANDVNFTNVSRVEELTLGTGGTTVNLGGEAEGAGIDTLNLSNGDDVVGAGAFDSGLTVNSLPGGGDDTVTTGSGADTYNFGDSLDNNDDLDAGDGLDTLNLAGDTTISGGNGFTNFEEVNLAGNSDIDGADYDLTLTDANGPSDSNPATNETLTVDGSGLGADDEVDFDSSAVTSFDLDLTTGAADDTVVLGGTDNTVSTNGGDDNVSGNLGAGTSVINTGADDDTVAVSTAAGGSVEVNSGAGVDNVTVTGAGAKTINLGDGDDLVAAEGEATINAEAGNDIIDVSDLDDGQTVDGGDDVDTVRTTSATTGDALFTEFSNVETFEQADNQGDVTLGSEAEEAGIRTIVDNDGGADSTYDASAFEEDLTVNLGGGDDEVTTGSGNDTVILDDDGTADANDLDLGEGDDTVRVRADNLGLEDSIAGGDGTDTVELDNGPGAVNAEVDLSQVTSVEQYTLTSSGNRLTGVDADSNTLTFSDGAGLGEALVGTDTSVNIDASLLTDGDDSLTVTLDTSLQDGDYAFIIDGAGTGVDVTVSKENLNIDNNITFNGAASNDSLRINGNDLGSTVAFTGGTGTDSIVQTGGIINDDGYRNVRGVEVLTAVTALDATLGQQAELSGLTTIIGGGGDDNVLVDAALDGTFDVDFSAGGDDAFDGDASDAVFNFEVGTELSAQDSISGGTTAQDTISITGGNSATNAVSAEGVTQVETINFNSGIVGTPDTYELRIDTKKVEINGDSQEINVNFDDSDSLVLNVTNSTADDANLTINLNGVVNADITLGQGNDVIYGNDTSGVLTADMGAGMDQVFVGDSAIGQIFGGDGNDMLYGGINDDLLAGGDGDDQIEGGAGNDDLFGGDGNDTIIAGSGEDRILGGAGADKIELSDDNVRDIVFYDEASESAGAIANDTITGFESGIDQIDVTSIAGLNGTIVFLGNVNNFAAVESSITAGTGVVQAVYDQVNDILYFDTNDDGNIDGDDVQINLSTEDGGGLVGQDVMEGAATTIADSDPVIVTDNSPSPFAAMELTMG